MRGREGRRGRYGGEGEGREEGGGMEVRGYPGSYPLNSIVNSR